MPSLGLSVTCQQRLVTGLTGQFIGSFQTCPGFTAVVLLLELAEYVHWMFFPLRNIRCPQEIHKEDVNGISRQVAKVGCMSRFAGEKATLRQVYLKNGRRMHSSAPPLYSGIFCVLCRTHACLICKDNGTRFLADDWSMRHRQFLMLR